MAWRDFPLDQNEESPHHPKLSLVEIPGHLTFFPSTVR